MTTYVRPDRFPLTAEPAPFGPIDLIEPRDLGASLLYDGIEYARIPGFRPLELDLYLPKSDAPVPLVVWIHGGGFMEGTRRYYPTDHAVVKPLVERLVAAGVAVAAVEYRYAFETPMPGQVHDAKAAIRYLRHFAADLGIDPDRIAVGGESAGGHLSAMAGLALPEDIEGAVGVTGVSTDVRAIVSWYPMTDFPVAFGDVTDHPEGSLFGPDPAARNELARRVSPTTWVTKDSAPILIITGDDDDVVPDSQSQLLRDAYVAAGAEVDFVNVPGADHCFYGVDPMPPVKKTAEFFLSALR